MRTSWPQSQRIDIGTSMRQYQVKETMTIVTLSHGPQIIEAERPLTKLARGAATFSQSRTEEGDFPGEIPSIFDGFLSHDKPVLDTISKRPYISSRVED